MGLLYSSLLLRFYEKVGYSCVLFNVFVVIVDCGVLNGGFLLLNFVFSSIMSVLFIRVFGLREWVSMRREWVSNILREWVSMRQVYH